MKKKLRISSEDLIYSLEDHSNNLVWYLDKNSGELISLPGEEFWVEEDEEMEGWKKIEEDPNRYLEIESIPSHESFPIMEKFVEGLPVGSEKEILKRALAWKKPFSNFKEALLEFPELREKWFHFHRQEMLKIAQKWLEVEGLEVEFTFPSEVLLKK